MKSLVIPTSGVTGATQDWTFAEHLADADYFELRSAADEVGSTLESIAQPKLSMAIRRPRGTVPDGTNRNTRVVIHVEFPVLREAPSGSQNSAGYSPPLAVDHRVVGDVSIVLPSNASAAYIERLGVALYGALAHADVQAGINARSVAAVGET